VASSVPGDADQADRSGDGLDRRTIVKQAFMKQALRSDGAP
jgi:hypothetical protein